MQAMRNYEWATDKVETVTRQHREAQACERRLRQIAAKREKDAKRAARKAAEAKVPVEDQARPALPLRGVPRWPRTGDTARQTGHGQPVPETRFV